MWSRMVCRSGGWFLLITSLLISHHTHGATRRKRETVYIADPVGIPLSKPSNVPAKVGSPAVLIQPDRYEFYTFDESGELIKRLMTLEEIQEIIATGDGDDGHILTIAQSDVNKPAVTFNFQPPSHTKVHSIVSNVQSVLKSEMEAQKNNPPKEGVFDTPDVSSSWSQILPAIFGNTGGNIAPDSLISPHVGPETDFLTVDRNESITPISDYNGGSVNEKIKPIEPIPSYDSVINTYTQAEDLLEDEIFQSKTTIDETSAEPTQSSTTTPKPTTKLSVKITNTTPLRIQTTERTISTTARETTNTTSRPSTSSNIRTNSVPERPSTDAYTRTTSTEKMSSTTPNTRTTDTSNRPSTSLFTKTTTTPSKPSTSPYTRTTTVPYTQTTSTPVKETTASYVSPAFNVKQTTMTPVKDSSTTQYKEDINSKQPITEEEKTTAVVNTSIYTQVNQNDQTTNIKPVNIVKIRPTSLPVNNPETIEITLNSAFDNQNKTEYDKVSSPNIKLTTFTDRTTTLVAKLTTPTSTRQPTTPPTQNTSKISTTLSTTEEPTAPSSSSTFQLTEKMTTAFIKPVYTRAPTSTPKSSVEDNRDNIQNYQVSPANVKPVTDPPRFDSTIIKIKPTSAQNIEATTAQVFQNKIQLSTETPPEYLTHLQISSSSKPMSSSITPLHPKPFSSSTAHHKPTTEKYAKPDIDINQIINQIAQNLGSAQQYNPSNTVSTHLPYNQIIHTVKDEITTYRPSTQKISDYSTILETSNEYLDSSANNKYNHQTAKPSETNINPTNKQPTEPYTTTNKYSQTDEIKLSTEKTNTVNNYEKPILKKPPPELSDSITNLISQIVDPKPISEPVDSNRKSTSSPISSIPSGTTFHNEPKSTTLRPTNNDTEGSQKIEEIRTTEASKISLNTEKFEPTTKRTETFTAIQQTQHVDEKKTTKTTTQTTIVSTRKPPSLQSVGGHYITKVSSVEKTKPSTNKFEIYKTSNAPTTTTIKKILTPEIYTQKPTHDKISTSPLFTENNFNKQSTLSSQTPNQPSTNFDDELDNKPESSNDYTEDTIYETQETGVTHDDELMEMLNKYSEMFNNSPDMEGKSDEISDDVDIPLFEKKKATSYKKTDIPEEEFYPADNLTFIPMTEKNTSSKNVSKEIPNTSTIKAEELSTTAKQDLKSTTEKVVEEAIISLNKTFTEYKPKEENVTKNEKTSDIVTINHEKVKETAQIKSNTDSIIVSIPDNKTNNENIPQSQTKENKHQNESSTPILEHTTPLALFININQTEKAVTLQKSTESLSTTKHTQDTKVTNIVSEKAESVQFITTEKYVNTNNEPTKQGNVILEQKNSNNKTLTDAINDFKHTAKPLTKIEVNSPESITSNSNENKDTIEKLSTVNNKVNTSTWTLVSTASPNINIKDNLETIGNINTDDHTQTHSIGQLHLSNNGEGLERTTTGLNEDVYQFSNLCNELGFRYWKAITSNGIDPKRSLFVSPFAVTSLLAMMFMATRGSTSEEINEILKLDDMVTFNPHIVFKNVTESIEVSKKAGVATSAIIRELYSDRSKGRLLSFYKDRVQRFYNGHVEEVNFSLIGDIIRRRTNLLVKRQTWSKIPEYIKHNNLVMKSPLAVFSANIFQTDCSSASTEGRDGEMYFVVSPTIRQRRLVPVPAVVYRSSFLAGYVTELDATAVAIGKGDQIVSTILVMPGQQGTIARGDDIIDLEKRLIDSVVKDYTWKTLLKSLIPRSGLELQIPRLSHRSIINGTLALKTLGMKDLFDPNKANLAGLNGQDNDLHVSDMILDNTFTTCGEGYIGEQHHVETYPGESNKLQRRLWRTPHRPLNPQDMTETWDDLRDYQRAFHDPLHDLTFLSIPLHLRPRQARLPDPITEPPRLKFDRPFMYFVRHNPTGLILHMGRYNPRLLP